MNASVNEVCSWSHSTNTSGGGADDELLASVRTTLDGLVNSVVVVVGCLCNVLALIVLLQPTMRRQSTNAYLAFLTTWNTVLLIATALLISLPALPSIGQHYSAHLFAHIVPFAYPIGLSAQTAQIWITVALSVERCYALNFPLVAHSVCSVRKALYVSSAVSVFSWLYNGSRWFEYHTVRCVTSGGQPQYTLRPGELLQSAHYLSVYHMYMYLFVMSGVPICSLVVLNACLARALYRARSSRLRMNVQQRQETSVTALLVMVVVVFIVCQVPALVYNVLFAVRGGRMHPVSLQILSSVRNFLVTLNSALDFFIYCMFGRRFRGVCVELFFGARFGRNGSVFSSHPTNPVTPSVLRYQLSTRSTAKGAPRCAQGSAFSDFIATPSASSHYLALCAPPAVCAHSRGPSAPSLPLFAPAAERQPIFV